jgi:hypothetical protein
MPDPNDPLQKVFSNLTDELKARGDPYAQETARRIIAPLVSAPPPPAPAPAPPPAVTTLKGMSVAELAKFQKESPALFEKVQREDARRAAGGQRIAAPAPPPHTSDGARYAVGAAGASFMPPTAPVPQQPPWDAPKK